EERAHANGAHWLFVLYRPALTGMGSVVSVRRGADVGRPKPSYEIACNSCTGLPSDQENWPRFIYLASTCLRRSIPRVICCSDRTSITFRMVPDARKQIAARLPTVCAMEMR